MDFVTCCQKKDVLRMLNLKNRVRTIKDPDFKPQNELVERFLF
jgi:hypothetical protein